MMYQERSEGDDRCGVPRVLGTDGILPDGLILPVATIVKQKVDISLDEHRLAMLCGLLPDVLVSELEVAEWSKYSCGAPVVF
jgi:hypothetical protein